MKYLVKFFVITASLFFITHSLADTKLAFIDMDKVLNESKAGKVATDELNKLNKKNWELLNKTEKKLFCFFIVFFLFFRTSNRRSVNNAIKQQISVLLQDIIDG